MDSKRNVLFNLMIIPLMLCFTSQAEADNSNPIIIPHKATYTMALESAKNGVSLTEISGKMTYDWKDVCDAWETEQRLILSMSFEEEGDTAIDSTIFGSEKKDESSYKFTAHRLSNTEGQEAYKGNAQKGKSAQYILPANKEPIQLKPEDHFPAGHTRAMIESAQKGERFFSSRLFDGSDEKGLSYVNAVINDAKKPEDPKGITKLKTAHPLLKSRFWPIRMAFFLPDSKEETPDYEMDVLLQENGIVREVHIDYGDFIIVGHLTELSENPKCEQKK